MTAYETPVVPEHLGAPAREQRELRAGRATVLLDRGVVTVSGVDRLGWLHSLTTQHLRDLAPYEPAESLLLSPHGHIEQDLHLVDDGEKTWITVECERVAALVSFLESMRFMLRVEVADRSADHAVVGECSRDRVPGEPAWVDPWPGPVGDTMTYGPQDGHPGVDWAWRERLVPAGTKGTAGTWAYDALRIAAWRPAMAEADHRTIPHELDWLRTAVHLNKGCYRGQETVARVRNLGRPPRRLVFLHLDGSEHELPAPGAPLRLANAPEGREVGRITSVARHFEDGPVALAVVKRNTDLGATLLAGDPTGLAVTAAQTAIVTP